MNARFLRDEAARFRDMAATTDREASKARFLAMAEDFEARAMRVHESAAPPHQDDEIAEPVEPSLDDAQATKPGRRMARASKATVVIERRSA